MPIIDTASSDLVHLVKLVDADDDALAGLPKSICWRNQARRPSSASVDVRSIRLIFESSPVAVKGAQAPPRRILRLEAEALYSRRSSSVLARATVGDGPNDGRPVEEIAAARARASALRRYSAPLTSRNTVLADADAVVRGLLGRGVEPEIDPEDDGDHEDQRP